MHLTPPTHSMIVSIVICAILYGSMTAQTDYFVATDGLNSNDGLSLMSPWKTIQYSMDNAPVGSIVNVRGGFYIEKIEINVSGTMSEPIVLKNYNQEEVIISGTGILAVNAIIGIFDHSYIHIEGLHITDNQQLDAQGIIVEGDCQGIEIRNNKISEIHFSTNSNDVANEDRNSQPLIVYGENGAVSVSDLVIENNEIYNCRTGYSEGLAVNGNVDGFVIKNNSVHDITNIGIDIIGHEETAPSNDQARNGIIKDNIVYNCKSPYATAAGIYVDGGKDLIIERNKVYKCQWGIEVGCENVGKSTSNVIVRSNVIYGNDDAGIVLGGFDYPDSSGKVEFIGIYNNTLYGNDMSDSGVGGVTGEISISYTENCKLFNNAVYGTNSSLLMLTVENVSSVNLELDYNLFYSLVPFEFNYNNSSYNGLSTYVMGSSQDMHSLDSDPLFISIQENDFHPRTLSPLKNNGDSMTNIEYGIFDFEGYGRVLDGRIDIGALEFYCPENLILSGLVGWDVLRANNKLTVLAKTDRPSSYFFYAPIVELGDGFEVCPPSSLTIINRGCD